MKKILYPCLALLLIGAWSCSKHNNGPNSAPALRLSRPFMIAGTIKGYTDTFTIESPVRWQMSMDRYDSGWLKLDSMSGGPGKTIVKFTVLDNYSTTYTVEANITVSPVDTTNIQPVQLAISQRVYTLGWQKALGGIDIDAGTAIIPTADGGYATAGYTRSGDGDVMGNHGNYDMWVVKLDGSGNKVWQKTLGGPKDDLANAITAAPDGGYVVAGFTLSNNGDVTGNHGGYDMWVVKLDGSGNKVWQKTLGGTGDDFANAITRSPDGGYVVAGYTSSADGDVLPGGHGGKDIWIVKLDGNGNKVWQKTLGGTSDEQAQSITATPDGGYVVAGFTASNDGDVSGNHGQQDYWVVKVDGNGNMLWQKCLGGTQNDLGQAITTTPDGGLAVTGFSLSTNGDVTGNHGGTDMWVVRLDGSGNLLWQKALGGSGDDEAYGITVTADGELAVAGFSSSKDGDVIRNYGHNDLWVVKLGSNGILMWEKNFGGSDNEAANGIVATGDGGFAITGYTFSSNGDVTGNHGSSDMWVIRLWVGAKGRPA